MNKQDKIDKIYKVILYNEFIEDLYPTNGERIFIGDVLDWIENRYALYVITNKASDERVRYTINLWETKRKPIEEQSKECINYLYNLLPND